MSVYALGDVTINAALASLTLLYASFFLTQVAGLRPALAGLVPLVGRTVDAFTDPLMGRISDRTRWRSGRRRPYFLIGAIPFGASFALLWSDPGIASELGRFLYYSAAYCLLSVAITVLGIPYLAIQPEMTLDYDARTSLNTYRTAGALLGIGCALAIRPLAQALGGGPSGFALAGGIFGIGFVLPWLAVYKVTFERPEFRVRATRESFAQALTALRRNSSFRILAGLYLCGRIAMDLVGALLILYVTYWLQRPELFELSMAVFLGTVFLVLPIWLRLSVQHEKLSAFLVGSVWWILCSGLFLLGHPEMPVALLLLLAALTGVGYAVVDLMPWAMLGEVVDEDDLRSGERREGLYNGAFTFIRKLGGAIGVALVLGLLDLLGFRAASDVQPEGARQAIRYLTALAPAVFLLGGIWIGRRYPLGRAAHARIRAELAERDAHVAS